MADDPQTDPVEPVDPGADDARKQDDDESGGGGGGNPPQPGRPR